MPKETTIAPVKVAKSIINSGKEYFANSIPEIESKIKNAKNIEDLKDAKIEAKIKDFLFPIDLEVKGFDIKFPRNKTITIEGFLFTDEVYELLKKARKNDIIIISNIRWKHEGLNGAFKTSPLVFKVIKNKKDYFSNSL